MNRVDLPRFHFDNVAPDLYMMGKGQSEGMRKRRKQQ